MPEQIITFCSNKGAVCLESFLALRPMQGADNFLATSGNL